MLDTWIIVLSRLYARGYDDGTSGRAPITDSLQR